MTHREVPRGARARKLGMNPSREPDGVNRPARGELRTPPGHALTFPPSGTGMGDVPGMGAARENPGREVRSPASYGRAGLGEVERCLCIGRRRQETGEEEERERRQMEKGGMERAR